MLYFKQLLFDKRSLKTTDNLLSEIPESVQDMPTIFSAKFNKKCEYDNNQYLFIYRITLKKIIEILDCILGDNQKPFIEPHRNINLYYPLLLFVYNDIALGKRKFLSKQIWYEADFGEFESLAGDRDTLLKTWKQLRPWYLDYLGKIENLFAQGGFKEFPLPRRFKIVLEQVDEILDYQRSQYNPTKTEGIKFSKDNLIYKNISVPFKNKGIRRNIVRLLCKNLDGLTSKTIRENLGLSSDQFKTIKNQINKRIKQLGLAIKYEPKRKTYLLSSSR